jgi:Family of unknown function (DUF6483)
MIRRDFILRMVEEMGFALAQIRALRKGGQTEAAREMVDEECKKFAAMGAEGILKLSEIELLAHVMEGQLAQTVHFRTLAVVALLREAGENSNEAGRSDEARAFYLKALHVLLAVLAQDDPSGFPDFVPSVESFVLVLQNQPLPLETQSMLLRHYEATGQFAKAEDVLYSMLKETNNDEQVLRFGRVFYERILRRSDASLAEGNLPRSEAQEGFAELQRLASA